MGDRTRRKWLTRGFATASVTAALVGATVVAAPAAGANSQGCTQSEIDGGAALLCTAVYGNSHGVYVDKVSISADIKDHTCNGVFETWGELPNGKTWRDRGQAKCGLGRVWVDFAPKRDFKNNVKLCGALVRVNGKVRPEHACVKIFK